MPQIPEFEPTAVPLPESGARVNPDALAAPGLAAGQLGAHEQQVGENLARLADYHDTVAYNKSLADAVNYGDTNFQSGREAVRSGQQPWRGFTQRQLADFDQYQQQALDQAPSAGVRARLERRFASERRGINTRAAEFEHQFGSESGVAQISDDADRTGAALYRDPSRFFDQVGRIGSAIDALGDQGLLDPARRAHLKHTAETTLATAALLGRSEQDPAGTMADLKAGRYDAFLDPHALETIQPRLRAGIAKAITAQMLPQLGAGGGGALAPPPASGAADAEIDRALTPIGQRENRDGNPNLGFGGVDLSNAPHDPTGFPIWDGRMGPQGISHAAGLYQIQPALWHEFAPALGIRDFSAESQQAVARAAYRKYGEQPWAASAPAAGGGLARVYARVDQMGLDPEIAETVKRNLRVNYDALEADQLRQQRLAAQQAKARSEAAEDAVIRDSRSPQPQISARDIAANDALTPEAKMRMIAFTAKDGQVDPATSHQTAIGLMKGIADGSVGDRAPLIDAFGQSKLNWQDFDHLDKQLADIKTPGGEQLSKRKEQLIKSVTAQIAPRGLLGTADPQEDQRLYGFRYMLDEKIDQYRADKKDPNDLFNPNKPDYLGSPEALHPYASPFISNLSDAATPAAAAPDLSSQAGIVAAYRAGHISRDEASRALIAGGYAEAPAAPAAPHPEPPVR